MKASARLWPADVSVEGLNGMNPGTLGGVLGMTFTEVGDDFLRMRMPVDERTRQPAGLLHGGASAALAETIGSVASYLLIDTAREAAVGTELSCSHLRGVRAGHVHAVCRAWRQGRSLHVWHVEIRDDDAKLVCVCRLTVTIVARRG